jgi:hypothetical protein
MSVRVGQSQSVQQVGQRTVTPDPGVERYFQLELGSVSHFRDIAALVLLHSLSRKEDNKEGKLSPEAKAGLKEALVKHGEQIDPDARKLLEQAVGLQKREPGKKVPFDVQLVKTYVGYTLSNQKIDSGEADYILTTARNIGGSKPLRDYVRTMAADPRVEPDARVKLLAWANEGQGNAGQVSQTSQVGG